MKQINSEMISLAREARGYTQSELAKLLGMTQGSLSKIEKGIQAASEDLIESLSQALNLPKNFFGQQEKILTPDLVYYRRRVTVKKKELLKAEAWLNIIRINIERLMKSVELPAVVLPNWDVETHGTPAEAAMLLRQMWKIPKGPITNLSKIVEDHGILIISFDFGSEKMDGISMYTFNGQPIIFINNKIPGDRQRITIAHEIGHLVMHFNKPVPTDRDIEKEAWTFAAELLVPAKEFETSINRIDIIGLAELKRYWRVSMASLLLRSKELELISDNQYRYNWQRMSVLGYRTKEPIAVEVPRENPTLLSELINAFTNDLNYSKEEMAEMMNLPIADMEHYYFERPKLRILRS